jgi:hypothetical protein
MSEIADFASTLLDDAKRFLELAVECDTPEGESAYRRAALMLGFCSLEASITAASSDFTGRDDLTLHEKSLLEEREVVLKCGAFELTDRLQMVRLEDRIQFVHRRFSGTEIDRTAPSWSDLAKALTLRNKLSHPKGATLITQRDVELALTAIIDTISAVYVAVYKRNFPAAGRGLQSKRRF